MAIPTQANACREPDPDNSSMVCGAFPAADERCLAHLSPDARAAYLATLSPGAHIRANGVTFTRELLAELLKALHTVQDRPLIGIADFSGATFTERADFSGTVFTKDADFTGATFEGDARFEGTSFERDAWFTETIFSRNAQFPGAEFRNGHFTKTRFGQEATTLPATLSADKANFGGVTFTEEADFVGTVFCGDAYFTEGTFEGVARFTNVTFVRNGHFVKARFDHEVSFFQTKFTTADFGQATFGGRASVAQTTFRLVGKFDEAVVEHELHVEALATSLTARELRGKGRLSLRLRAARVDLTDVMLAGPVNVQGLQDLIFHTIEAEFRDPESNDTPDVRVTSLQRLDAVSVTLIDVDLTECLFTGLRGADQIHLDGRCKFMTDPRRRRRVLVEEHHWRAHQHVNRWRPLARLEVLYRQLLDMSHRLWKALGMKPRRLPDRWTPAPRGMNPVEPARLEVLYRQLRKALEDAKNEPGAADFYYGEMEMRRAGARHGEKLLLWTYWLVSGYGLRVGRVITALLILVAVLALGMQYAGFPGKPVPYLDVLLYSLRSTVALDVKSSAVPGNVTRWGQVFRIVLRIVGPLFVGLAALTIRNRVKR